MKQLIHSLLFITFLQGSAFSLSDFLVVTNPDQLSIFNQYEQPLTESEKKAFCPYMPFQIIKENVTLGDQITEALKCSNLGSIYFLIKNENGGFVSSSHVVFQKFSNCIPLGDTVEALKNTILSEKVPTHGIETEIKKGELLFRVFQNGSNQYFFRPVKPQKYGWSTSPGVFKELKKIPKQTATTDYSDVALRIEKRLSIANDIYKTYFNYFNNLTHDTKSIPIWEFKEVNSNYRCVLKGSPSTVDQLQESTRYIVQEIEQQLIGKPFSVNASGNEINILHR